MLLLTCSSINHKANVLKKVFDNIKFNQDIFVTSKCHDKSGPVNYHIELERVRLDLSESTTATLKDIRSIASDAVV